MKNSEIGRAVLRRLYEAHFDGNSFNLPRVREEHGWDQNSFDKVVDRMANDGLIRGWTAGGNYRITMQGILYAEQEGIAPEELRNQNQQARTVILDILAKVYEESGSFATTHISTVPEKTGLDQYCIAFNLQVLEDAGYAETTGSGSKITHAGLDAVEEWRKRSSLADELERISQLSPQARGRALQKLFAAVVEHHGWSQEEGVRTPHEEMDVIVYKGREYYLVECKWEKSPSEADVIRELHGKLSNRVDVRGIAVSMSGFTQGAKKQVEDYANSRVILLFGIEDVRAIVYRKSQFEDLLDEKYRQLATRRNAVFN
jgi:predicted transcriptional regulator